MCPSYRVVQVRPLARTRFGVRRIRPGRVISRYVAQNSTLATGSLIPCITITMAIIKRTRLFDEVLLVPSDRPVGGIGR